MSRGYVVLDFETTGLSPVWGHRVLEVGAVSIDTDLKIDGVFETLVNPGRDVGPTRIHGISARDVFDAPKFSEIAPALLEFLQGRVVVGHNLSFDLRFLTAELERDQFEVPEVITVDTLQASKSLLRGNPPSSFKLHDIASHVGVRLPDVMQRVGYENRPAHSALGDAMVTTFLLGHLIGMSATSRFWQSRLQEAALLQWPEIWPTPVQFKVRNDHASGPVASVVKPAAIDDVLRSLGADAVRVHGTRDYSSLLEQSLADRVLDSHEIDALVQVAQSLGLDGVTLGSLHRGQFDQVVRAAWADGVITEDERTDIIQVATLLGIDQDSVDAALGVSADQLGEGSGAEAQLELLPGDRIVLTGDMTVPRSAVEAELVSRGFVVSGSVSKKTALVIAADPYTQSGKAKKAREYGVPVLGEREGLALARRA